MSASADERQEQFLVAFVEADGNLETARKNASVSKLTFYRWLREDETFRKRFDEYRLTLAEVIEDEAIKRVLNPVGQRGSDALATTLLKGLKKDRYGDVDKSNSGVNIIYVSALRDRPRVGVEDVVGELPSGDTGGAGLLAAPQSEPVAEVPASKSQA